MLRDIKLGSGARARPEQNCAPNGRMKLCSSVMSVIGSGFRAPFATACVLLLHHLARVPDPIVVRGVEDLGCHVADVAQLFLRGRWLVGFP